MKRIAFALIVMLMLVGSAWASEYRNPASGAVNEYQCFGNASHAVILIQSGTHTWQQDFPVAKMQEWAARGFFVCAGNPDGRGGSGGTEDYGGSIHQWGLKKFIETVSASGGITEILIQAHSFGGTVATGTLRWWPGLPVGSLILVETPANRWDTCPTWALCDSPFWTWREASTHIPYVWQPIRIVQGDPDHVQLDPNHTVTLNNASTHWSYGGGGVSNWTQVNDPSMCIGSWCNDPNKLYGYTPATWPVRYTSTEMQNIDWPRLWADMFATF